MTTSFIEEELVGLCIQADGLCFHPEPFHCMRSYGLSSTEEKLGVMGMISKQGGIDLKGFAYSFVHNSRASSAVRSLL
ncbi:hypothetical protein GOP47_0012194 [Adiantum capillus-veneris]|uniref:Uncharacterized protein n=1 Tax=Adiantum capillus-veneris TaxID=13818 RepID=A0A9D4UQ85_ADICA|nr:hypothetical protein GOP47_0012194 [Adiantum capillus-veneris]